ncbi:MAG: DivIVA domain-containing protein [Erysipelotrichaceae bacterium]|nr:DivIVA domain-containing protein [Erysipelotrichaceae bacterium]MDD4642157.1 DivIVA domain-containing protein [Erysipelotrichaceae bacterium]
MKEKLTHSVRSIYDKAFAVEFKGYAAEEVDSFLDDIIKDYKIFDELMITYENEMSLLKQNNAALKSYIIELEAKVKFKEESTPANASDILKRLSRLESLLDISKRSIDE